ncbi:MAG: hypothetical protein IPH57_15550 [Saprospiraceae bacterium]|nr:hypothetical protein [Saprospiraceae bacterium]
MNSRKKILNSLLILTSLIGYLEWPNNHGFLFQLQYELLFGSARDIKNFLHPAIFFPMTGELILIYTLFQKIPGRILTFIGMACIAVLMIILLIVGVAASNLKIAGSSIPFFVTAFFILKFNFKKNKETPS